jgi:hypothetical protein
VRGLEGFGDLPRDRQSVARRKAHTAVESFFSARSSHPAEAGSHLQPFRQRRPVDQLHHQRGRVVASLQAMDLRDVWMVQGGEDLGLALKSGPGRLDRTSPWGSTLMATARFEVGIGGPLHLAHPSGAEKLVHFVGAKTTAWSHGHRSIIIDPVPYAH